MLAAWSNLTGFTFIEVANKSNMFLQGPHTEQERLRVLQEAVREGKTTTVRLLNYTKSGDPFYNTLTIYPLRDANGALSARCSAPISAACTACCTLPQGM